MRLVLLGCPGAGKGTQAAMIKEQFHIPQISTGDILRAAVLAGTPLGMRVKQIMADGHLVSDDIVITLVKERIQSADCENGFLLDGFPRTIPQAEALRDNNIHLDYVIEIDVPDEELIKRLSGRRVHPGSGRVYHVLFHPPKIAGIDDMTGEPLVHRPDDQEESIKKRLEVYHHQTKPLIDYYTKSSKEVGQPKYVKVSGMGDVNEITQRILSAMKK